MNSINKIKAIQGFRWTLFERMSKQSLRFIIGIILARLLLPEDYGIISMVIIFLAISETFSAGGFGAAYVSKKIVSEKDSNTIFYTNLLLSLCFYVILWFAAPLISNFYNIDELINITRVMGFLVIINSLNIIQFAKFTRDINFKLQSKIRLSATLLSGIVGIVLAYNNFGVWSLVFHSLSRSLVTTVGIWSFTEWWPSLQYSFKSLREIFSIGIWYLFSGLTKVFFDNIYYLVIGKIYTATDLGYYTRAKQFQYMSAVNISGTLSTVAFPLFSKYQDNNSNLRRTFRKTLQYSLIFTIPILVNLIVVADSFILLLLTDRWSSVIIYFRLLLLIGLLYPIHELNMQILRALNQSHLFFFLDLIKGILRIINIFLMYQFGIVYIIIGEIIISLLSIPINTFYTYKFINYGLIDTMKDTYKLYIFGILSGIVGFYSIISIDNLFIKLALGLVITSSFFISMQFLFNRALLIRSFNIGYRNIIFNE